MDTPSTTRADGVAGTAVCPACGASCAAVHRALGDVVLRICPACGLRYADPRVHPGQRWYEDSSIYAEVRWHVPAVSRLADRWEFAQALGQLGPGDRVLDVGCGRGDFLKLAESRRLRACGIDLNLTLLEVARSVYGLTDVHHSSIEGYSRTHSEPDFDAVTAFEVMEHLPDPMEFVRSCRSLLRPRGKLVLSVPGFDRWPPWVNSPVDLPPHHLTLWTETGLRALLVGADYEDVRTLRRPLMASDLMYHAVRRAGFLQAPGVARRAARGILKLALIPAWLAMRLHRRSGGFTLFAVATRPSAAGPPTRVGNPAIQGEPVDPPPPWPGGAAGGPSGGGTRGPETT